MLPVMLDLKFFKLYTFGVFLVLAFFWGCFLLWKNFLLTPQKEEDIFDGLFFSIAGGLFVSRLVHVILNFKSFGFDALKFILINGYPGLSMYGFLTGATLTFYLFCYIKKIKFSEVADYFVPSMFLTLGFGKLGAFFSGAEIGSKTAFFLALKYPGISGTRHPTALYESLLFFLASFLSYQLLFEIRRGRHQKTENFSFFWWYFSLVYLLFDALKARRILLYGLSFNSLISLFLLLTFTFYFLYYFKNSLRTMGDMITNFFSKKHGKGISKIFHKKSKT